MHPLQHAHRMPPPLRRFFISGLLIAALVVLVGVGFLAWIGEQGGRLTPVPPATSAAADIQDIYVFIGAFASFIFLVVTIPLALFVVRFRSGGRDRSVEGAQIRGNTRLELFWTFIPVLFLAAMATFVFVKLPGIREPASAGGDAPVLRVLVEGRQFYWRYVYPNGAIAIDRLRLPVDRNVELEIRVPEWDVIHSFWIPALGGKVDAIPAIETDLKFRATRTGVYEGTCAELCGIQHGLMLATAEVMPQQEFERWTEETARAQEAGRSKLGEELYTGVCAKCHDLAPEFAPRIAGSPVLAQRDAVTSIVQNGRGRMPPVGRGWTDTELNALLDFVETIAGGTS
jgi:cytochrome c oxidase subunit II